MLKKQLSITCDQIMKTAKDINSFLNQCTPMDLIASGMLIVCFVGAAVHFFMFAL